MKVAEELADGLLKNNVKLENIFLDPLVQPVSVNNIFMAAKALSGRDNLCMNFLKAYRGGMLEANQIF
jgi:hypothetical protein